MCMSANRTRFFGRGLPYVDVSELKGKLIVIEGTDGVGRSSQIDNLRRWLEIQGYGVNTTGWTRSPLMGEAINEAKAGHTLNVNTFSLLYAADFADRLENEILPALRSGFIVLARSIVRGADREWIKKVFGFALQPDVVFYMQIELENLIPRVITSETLSKRYWEEELGEGMDYWESGMDLRLGEDFYDSFIAYQKRILHEFRNMAKRFNFRIVDAGQSFEKTNQALKQGIKQLLDHA